MQEIRKCRMDNKVGLFLNLFFVAAQMGDSVVQPALRDVRCINRDADYQPDLQKWSHAEWIAHSTAITA